MFSLCLGPETGGASRYNVTVEASPEWHQLEDLSHTCRTLLVYMPNGVIPARLAPAPLWAALLQRDFGRLPVLLGLDYALVAHAPDTEQVWLSRGGVGRVTIFFAWHGTDLHIEQHLPRLDETTSADETALAAFLANCASPVPSDVVHTTATLLSKRGWHRVVRAAVTEIALPTKQFAVHHYQLPDEASYRACSDNDLIAAYRDAVERHLMNRATAPYAVELSGGIDSSIIAGALERIAPGGKRFGVSLIYPYYEFRHERRYIEAVNARLGWHPVFVDGARTLLFDTGSAQFTASEPTRLASGYAQLSAVTNAALVNGARVLFNGHGADQLFGMSPYARTTLFKPFKPRISLDLLEPRMASMIQDHIQAMQRIHEDGDPRGHRHYFAALALYDRWMPSPDDARLACDPGLLSVDTLRLSWEVFRRPRWQDTGIPGKKFAREAFGDWMPDIVHQRRWKVGYDGLYRRGLARNASRLIAMLTRQREHLRAAGIDTQRSIARLERCRQFYFEDMELLIGIVSYCIWREAAVSSGAGRPCHTPS